MKKPIADAVRESYGAAARSGLSSDHDGVRAIAEAFGYSPEQLTSIPAEANIGLSCGNPTAVASLRPGETVVDLGCGGGLDVLLAARQVGPTGKVIGIDMTQDMVDLATRNAARADNGQPLRNVEFHLASIDAMPLPDAIADCVISNCVLNLASDKPAVFREIARIVKPGGRLAISDIALKRPLPEELAGDLSAMVGCIAGAIEIDQYRRWLVEAGFTHVEIVDSGADLNAYGLLESQAACCSPAMSSAGGLQVLDGGCCSPAPESEEPGIHERLAALLRIHDVNRYAASVRVFAHKPA